MGAVTPHSRTDGLEPGHVVGGETSQTLDRGLRVLELLGAREHAAGMTVTELAAELEVGRPVVYRLVATLESRDFVVRRDDGRVRLGLAVARLARAVLPLVREAAMPTLHALADRVGATAHLTVADSGEALALAVVEPTWTDFHVAYRVGSRHPLERGAAGRAILAGRDGGSPVVATDGELQDGAHGLAVPLTELPGLEASIGVVSLTPIDAASVGPILLSAARAVGQALR